MLIRRIARPQALSQSKGGLCERCAQAAPSWAAQQRPFHPSPSRLALREVPELDNQAELEQNGIPNLYTPSGFKLAWTDYQAKLLTNLNAQIDETRLTDSNIAQLIQQTARSPTHANIFTHASQLWNNHFYMSGLTTTPIGLSDSTQSTMSPRMAEYIKQDFGSVDNLATAMLGHASAMFGPGYVWLVRISSDKRVAFKLLSTYAAGSPLNHAHWRQQSREPGTFTSPNEPQVEDALDLQSAGTIGSVARGTEKRGLLGQSNHQPILCVSTWQHSYIEGFAHDKEAFLFRWWNRVDWEKVEKRARNL